MSRHTTSFTTDPMYRARNELRNRLERIRGEAQTTAQCVGEFPGNEVEKQMWQNVDALCEGYINGLVSLNEVDRQNKTTAASAARFGGHQIGHELGATEYVGREPA